MIDPNNTNTIRVGELPSEPFSLTDSIPHEVGTELKRGTVQQLSDFIATVIEVTGGVGFRAVTVTDGQTLPTTTQQEFILVGKGTYLNVNGGDTLVLTEELNAIVSNGSFWFVGVEIPIDVELAGITQFIREGFTNTAPSENAVFNALANIDLSIKENTANKQNSLVADGTGVKFPTVDAVNKAVTFVTPELFGAVGDGITDDKTAIQNALNSGKTVFFANKRYYISGSLTVPAGATINGSGTGTATNILITANEPAFILNGNNITIKAISILGSRPISNPMQHGISLIGNSDLTSSFERIVISDCAFYDLGGAGFYSRTNGSTNFSSAQISNSYAYQCRIGFWFDDRAEYNNLANIKAHKNGTGVVLKGGNNLITGLISTFNDVNVKLEGSLNDGHTSIAGAQINHGDTYNVFSEDLTLGYTFNSCAFYAGDIFIKNSKGVRFLNSEIGATNNIYFQNSTESSFTNVAFLANPNFYLKWNGTNNTGVESEVKFFNNNFWAGTPASVVNNELNDGLVVSSGDIKAYEGQKIGFRYSSGTPIFANYMTTSEANPFSFFGLWTSTPSTEMFNFNTNLGKIVSIFNNGDFKINGSYQSNTLAGTGTRLVNASPTGQLGAISMLPVFADNTAAIAGGLGVGALYRTVIGLLAIVF